MGFDILDDMINHAAYDDLDSCIDRQTQILAMLKELIHGNVDSRRLQQAARHNQNLLEKFSMTSYQDCEKVIDHAANYV